MAVRRASPSFTGAMRFLLGQPNFTKLVFLFAGALGAIAFWAYNGKPSIEEIAANTYVQEHYASASPFMQNVQRRKFLIEQEFAEISYAKRRKNKSDLSREEALAQQIRELQKSGKVGKKDAEALENLQKSLTLTLKQDGQRQQKKISEALNEGKATADAKSLHPVASKGAVATAVTLLILVEVLAGLIVWGMIMGMAAVGFKVGAQNLPAFPRTSPLALMKLGVGVAVTFLGRIIIWLGIFMVAIMFLCPAGFRNIASLLGLYFLYRAFWGGHRIFVAFCLTGDFRVIFSARRCMAATSEVFVGHPIMIFLCYTLGLVLFAIVEFAIQAALVIPLAFLDVLAPARVVTAIDPFVAHAMYFFVLAAAGLYFGQIFRRWQPVDSPLAYHSPAPVKKLPVQRSSDLSAKLNRYKIG